jgi:hypothetical protein
MWGPMINVDTRYSFWGSLAPVPKRVKAVGAIPTDSPSELAFLSPSHLPSPKQGMRIRRLFFTVQTEHLLPSLLHSLLTGGGKLLWKIRDLLRLSLLVLGQGRRQGGGQVNAQVVGEQQDDEEDVTELISNGTGLILGRPGFVAISKVQLATELTDFFRQACVLGKGRPVATSAANPFVDGALDAAQIVWQSLRRHG